MSDTGGTVPTDDSRYLCLRCGYVWYWHHDRCPQCGSDLVVAKTPWPAPKKED